MAHGRGDRATSSEERARSGFPVGLIPLSTGRCVNVACNLRIRWISLNKGTTVGFTRKFSKRSSVEWVLKQCVSFFSRNMEGYTPGVPGDRRHFCPGRRSCEPPVCLGLSSILAGASFRRLKEDGKTKHPLLASSQPV